MKQQSPLLRIWELGEKEHGRLIGAIVLAAVGVIGGMVPYFAAAKMVALLMSGERDLSVYLIWGCRTDFADIQNKKECGGNRQWQNHYLRNWAANTKGKGII